jgi:hypothetical protein
MNGQCDTCGQPATHQCAVAGCIHQMCDEHTTLGSARDIDMDTPPAYCPEHAPMASRDNSFQFP